MPEEGTSQAGVTIPEEYRDRLYEWVVDGPFDGCLWKKSHGVVDADGNFHQLTAAGRDLDDFTDVAETEHGLRPSGGWNTQGWNARRLAAIKARHGFPSVEPPAVQVARLRADAIERVFGEKWYMVDHGRAAEDARVKAAVADAEARLKAYESDVAAHMRERQSRLNALFLGAALDETPDDWKSWPLDEARVKESCRLFCLGCGDDAGVMCTVLDGLVELGYDAWCTCSDCGEQFMPTEYGEFGALLDPEAYRGNGGIGVVMTRVQCGRCRAETECPKCGQPNLPPRGDGTHRYDHYGDVDRFMCQWLGVCEYCADRFLREKEYSRWRDEISDMATGFDEDAARLREYVSKTEDDGLDGERLAEFRTGAEKAMREKWRTAVNAMRDRMEDDVAEYFDIVGIGSDRLEEGDTEYEYR